MTTNRDILLSAARLLDASAVSSNSGGVTFRGKLLSSYNPLYPAIGVPGILCRDLVAEETSTEVDTQLNRDFLAQVKSLWTNRLAKTAYFTLDQVRAVLALLEVGVYVAPVNERAIQNADPARAVDLVEPPILTAQPATRAGWDKICAEFKVITSNYIGRQQELARQRGAELEANAAFWDEVYKEYAAALKKIGSAFVFGFGSIVGVAALVAVLYVFGPRILASAGAKAKGAARAAG